MLGLEKELAGFLTAVLSGMAAVCAYTGICRFRRLVRHSPLLIELEDALYWISMAVYLFGQIYKTSNGVLRWYFVVGAAAGALIFGWMERFFFKRIRQYAEKRKRKWKKKSWKTIEIDSKKR